MTDIKPQSQMDGIHSMIPRDRQVRSVRKLRDTYALVSGACFVRREFGYYCLEQWYEQGLDRNADLAEVFQFDAASQHFLGGLGWCEAAFVPKFEEVHIEDRGDHEVVQDVAGRRVLYFKGRRSGFMPEYLEHPVKDMRTWQENVKWRLVPDSPQRWAIIEPRLADAVTAARQGMWLSQQLIGGYMFLRSLIGPTDLMYAFYDMPDVIHDCMQTWLKLADAVIGSHQQQVCLDELFLAEDICYNHGPLISPDMIKEFLFPYYQQLISNTKMRQLDRHRHLHIQIDTDGHAEGLIELFQREIGMDAMSPFEVASGCDVVKIGRQYPKLAMFGGIDKRVLAKGKDAIDRHLEHILPAMRARGGYIPTCDHGVPAEVTLENYLHYRKRCVELGG